MGFKSNSSGIVRDTLNVETDHNVYILGAGFSVEANMPTMVSFLSRMRDCYGWLISQKRTPEAKAVQDVLEFRRSAASAAYWITMDLDNIEELFSLASTTSKKLSNSIRSAIASTLDYSAQTRPAETMRFGYEGKTWVSEAKWLRPYRDQKDTYLVNPYSHHVAKLLGMHVTGTPKGKNTFITFNYDTVLEEALADLGVGYDYCLHGGGLNRSVPKNGDKHVRVLKLHGSVNWGRGKRTKGGSEKRSISEFKSYKEVFDAGKTPELIAPTWRKIFGSHLHSVWDEAIDVLGGATRVVVIGFSIPSTDAHIKYLLAGGLQENISLKKFIFCDPDIVKIKTRATSLFPALSFERDYAAFYGIKLSELTAQSSPVLSEIGRPEWTAGTAGSTNFHGLSLW